MSLNRTDFEVKQRIAALPPIVRAQLTEILEEILNGSTQRNFSCATLIAGATALSGNVSLGESGDGVDLTAFGDTAGKYFKWDAATDSFILVGDLAVNTDKFTVDHATGNTVVGGTLDSTGDLTVGADKFNVDAGTGDTQIDGTLNVDGQAVTAFEVGAKAGIPEFAVVEEGMGGFHKTILTLTDVPLTVSDDAGVGQWAAHLLYTFPTGLTHILGATANLDLGQRSSLCGERGLKLQGTWNLSTAVGRSLCGERGLKLFDYDDERHCFWSLPLRGAWIETSYTC